MKIENQVEYRKRFQEELPIILAAQNGCPEAIEKLVLMSLPVRRAFAIRYFPNNASMHDDALQVGWTGSANALKKWDPTKEICFIDWCRYQIREAVCELKYKMEKVVARPYWIGRKISQMNTYQTESLQELADLMSCPTYQIEVFQGLRSTDLSLSPSKCGSDDPASVSQRLIHNVTPYDELSKSELISMVINCAQSLTDRERRILDACYDLSKGESLTRAEIGECFGMTRRRVEQIESEALGKIRSYFERLDRGLILTPVTTQSRRPQKRRNFCRRRKRTEN